MKKAIMGNSAKAATPSHKPTHDQIAAAARQLYFESGQLKGRDEENWLRAERLLMQSIDGRASQPAEVTVEQPQPRQFRPVERREHPFSRDERGSPSREEIRRQTTQVRPGARAPMSPAECRENPM